MHIEDQAAERLAMTVSSMPTVVELLDLRSLLSSCVIELRSLRELCKQQRKRIDQLMEEVAQ